MKPNEIGRKLLQVSPVILLLAAYTLPLVITFTMTTPPPVPLAWLMILLVVLFPPLAIGLSIWHLVKRRRIGESLVALALALPMFLIWEGSIRRAVRAHQLQQITQPGTPASR